MNAELINPFINATVDTISTMCRVTPVLQKPAVKGPPTTWGDLTGVIEMASDSVKGNMLLSFDEKGAIFVVNQMLSESFSEVSQEIIDAVGELTNIISGGAKKRFSEMGYDFKMATPVTIKGKGTPIPHLQNDRIIQLPFQTESGVFVLEIDLLSTKSV